ncbi:MAG: hypothetical protein ACE15C_03735 [Phycisphaerae bacterium]
MSSEKEWVLSLLDRLRAGMQDISQEGGTVRVESGYRLSYLHEILAYSADGRESTRSTGYETDILVSDVMSNGSWIPRVVVECKTWGVTTHDALTYSNKAATHKNVHPYLRYGILVGNFGDALPARLVRHGAHFDFMMVWGSDAGTPREWQELLDLLKDEVASSRKLQQVLTDRTWGKRKYRLLHRPLRLFE